MGQKRIRATVNLGTLDLENPWHLPSSHKTEKMAPRAGDPRHNICPFSSRKGYTSMVIPPAQFKNKNDYNVSNLRPKIIPKEGFEFFWNLVRKCKLISLHRGRHLWFFKAASDAQTRWVTVTLHGNRISASFCVVWSSHLPFLAFFEWEEWGKGKIFRFVCVLIHIHYSHTQEHAQNRVLPQHILKHAAL